MSTNEKSTAKIVDLVSRLVERGDTERAELIASVAAREEAGEDPAVGTDGGGFDWRAFAVHFAQQNPRLTMFAPISVLCWFYLIYRLVAGA